jgi:phosphoribosyl 1,2-cyclic phosphodiesterase
MGMNLKVLATGSRGNCYILETARGKILLDCGVRIQEIKEALGFDLTDVVGCLLTHEHKDHSKAAAELMALGVDVYTSAGTAAACGLTGHRLHAVQGQRSFEIGERLHPRRAGNIAVMPFNAQHDALDPFGFLIQLCGEKILYATDTYYLEYRFSGLNYIIVECNYMTETLDNNIKAGRIPRELRRRLLKSHFALHNLVKFLQASDLKRCRQIVLVHLSDGNSDALRMVGEIYLQTGVQTVAADAGMDIPLEGAGF